MSQTVDQQILHDKQRWAVASATLQNENDLFGKLKRVTALDDGDWARIETKSVSLIEQIRSAPLTPLIDQFLTEYGLSTDEGVQLMRLAEALSRTVDATTANELIRDKLTGRDWLAHSGKGRPIAMRLSAYALHISSKWLRWTGGDKSPLAKTFAKPGNAVLRWATRFAIKILSSQFVFAGSLPDGLNRAEKYGRNGYTFSFDMLGEAARTKEDARKYYAAYADALDMVAQNATSDDPQKNHGISIKLSALHPRYEFSQAGRVVPEIVEMLLPLALKARAANVQITIDAEEAERLDISMSVLSELIAKPELHGWQGLGFVVQAYQRRALPLIDWLQTQADQLGAPLVIRLVKGAYWDSEIKRAQEMGLDSYPVYTRKEMTDLSYVACARKLLEKPDVFTPQFATHNAHSIAAIKELARPERKLEFQRLFGMGQQLHDILLSEHNVTSRIYAPVGTQKDLLSYLIRRLLENGVNSSFVNKLADPDIDPLGLSISPVKLVAEHQTPENSAIPKPREFLQNGRKSATGWELSSPEIRKIFEDGLQQAATHQFSSTPMAPGLLEEGDPQPAYNPSDLNEIVGHCSNAKDSTAKSAVETAHEAHKKWSQIPPSERAAKLEKAATLLEQRASVFHYLAIKEAGKSWSDAIDELREAVDFCRYYAHQANDESFAGREALGVVVCISPWNFPLAIFLGQVTAALAAGNTVVAKPAEQTPLIAAEAVHLLHDAGIDPSAICLVPGSGAIVGEALVSHPLTAGVCFTGSTATAKRIARRLAETGRALTPLIAETGGINAMIVDSSALLEQTVDAIVSSAFQSAGQRCSALRLLCVQDDIADELITLLSGAMKELQVGDPITLKTDVGPVIDKAAKQNIEAHIQRLDKFARKVGQGCGSQTNDGHFIDPVAYELNDFTDLDKEIFGPVLHIIRFASDQKMELADKINQSGYGLTLGIQSRIDYICDDLAKRADVGNIYINRNQIGAVVGVQPFGGQGLSGTGPKAGGPLYLLRLSRDKRAKNKAVTQQPAKETHIAVSTFSDIESLVYRGILAQKKWTELSLRQPLSAVVSNWQCDIFKPYLLDGIYRFENMRLADEQLPSPAGETNHYHVQGKGLMISFLEKESDIIEACLRSLITGNGFLQVYQNQHSVALAEIIDKVSPQGEFEALVQQGQYCDWEKVLEALPRSKIAGILIAAADPKLDEIGLNLANKDGPIIAMLTAQAGCDRYVHEKTITRNIAAAGGDVSLLNS